MESVEAAGEAVAEALVASLYHDPRSEVLLVKEVEVVVAVDFAG